MNNIRQITCFLIHHGVCVALALHSVNINSGKMRKVELFCRAKAYMACSPRRDTHLMTAGGTFSSSPQTCMHKCSRHACYKSHRPEVVPSSSDSSTRKIRGQKRTLLAIAPITVLTQGRTFVYPATCSAACAVTSIHHERIGRVDVSSLDT